MNKLYQIYVIFWKNLLIRYRLKWRLFIDVLWPLIFVSIIALVRMKEERLMFSSCYLSSRALPSSGLLPFLSSVLCETNNTCHADHREEAILRSNFGRMIKHSLRFLKMSQNLNKTKNVMRSLRRLNGIISFNSGELDNGPLKLLINDEVFSVLSRFYCENVEFDSSVKLTNKFARLLSSLYDERRTRNLFVNQTKDIRNIFVNMLHCSTSFKGLMQTILLNLIKPKLLEFNLNNEIIKELYQVSDDIDELFIMLRLSGNIERIFDNFNSIKFDLKGIGHFFCGENNDIDNLFTPTKQQQSFLDQYSTKNLTDRSQTNLKISTNCYLKNFSLIRLPDVDERNRSCKYQLTENSLYYRPITYLNFGDYKVDETTQNNFIIFPYKHSISMDNLNCERLEEIFTNTQFFDNTTSCACNRWFATMSLNTATRFLYYRLESLLFGNIVYTPINDKIDRIIKKANGTFDGMGNLFELLSNNSIRQLFEQNLFPTNFTKPFNDMMGMMDMTQCVNMDRYIGVENEDELMRKSEELYAQGRFWAAIVFNKKDEGMIDYQIRMTLSMIDGGKQVQDLTWRPQPRASPSIYMTKYFSYGFIYIEDMIERAIIDERIESNDDDYLNEMKNIGISMQQFPFPCHSRDKLMEQLADYLPLMLMLGWLWFVGMTTRDIVYEREMKLREMIAVMGASYTINWMGYILSLFPTMLLSSILLTIIEYVGDILPLTNMFISFLMNFLYPFALMGLSSVFSLLFNRSNLAAVSSALLYFISYIPSQFYRSYDEDLVDWHRYLASFSPSIIFMQSLKIVLNYENEGKGMTWKYLNIGNSTRDVSFTLLHSLIIHFLFGVITIILSIYFDNIFPGEFGISRSWKWPIEHLCRLMKRKRYYYSRSSRLFPSKKSKDNLLVRRLPDDYIIYASKSYREMNHPKLNDKGMKDVVVELQYLTKSYQGHHTAIKDLNVSFHSNEIIGLLGENGAGKTTTMNIICGIISPTNGTAIINRMDVRRNMKEIRQTLSYVPQHNILYPMLTVYDHLLFYSRMSSSNVSQTRLMDLLSDVKLTNKLHEKVKTLSGGMKRRLCVAIAFLNESANLIILDEPTAGVDPLARRIIWNLLLKRKRLGSRCIILSTHNMYEADVLSDHITILSNGLLAAYGTSLTLKERYSNSYHLVFTSNNSWSQNEIKKIVDEINNYSINYSNDDSSSNFIRVSESNSDQIQIVLNEFTNENLKKLIKYFENKKFLLHIHHIALYDSSLDDVFVNVIHNHRIKKKQQLLEINELDNKKMLKKKLFNFHKSTQNTSINSNHNISTPSNIINDGNEITSRNSLTPRTSSSLSYDQERIREINEIPSSQYRHDGNWMSRRFSVFHVQFSALILRRLKRLLRTKIEWFMQIVAPVLVIALFIVIGKVTPKSDRFSILAIHPWYYEERENYIFLQNITQINPFMNEIRDSFFRTEYPSYGHRCSSINPIYLSIHRLKKMYKKRLPCFIEHLGMNENQLEWEEVMGEDLKVKENCSCSSGFLACPKHSAAYSPQQFNVYGGDTLLLREDQTKNEIEEWLKLTRYTSKYFMKRNGGYSFDDLFHDLFQEEDKKEIYEQFSSILDNLLNEMQTTLTSNQLLTRNRLRVWFNNKAWISSIAYLNLANNQLLRLIANQSTSTINLFINPMNLSRRQSEIEIITDTFSDVISSIFVILAVAIIPGSFLTFLIHDRVSKAKHLQMLNGLPSFVYWLTYFIWDMVNLIFASVLIIIVFLIFDVESFIQPQHIPTTFLLFLLFGLSIAPLNYLASFILNDPSTSSVIASSVNTVIGIATTLGTVTLELSNKRDLVNLNKYLKKIFLIFPQYAFGRGLLEMNIMTVKKRIGRKFLDDNSKLLKQTPFHWDICGKHLLSMTIIWIVGMFFLFLVQSNENGKLSSKICWLKKKKKTNSKSFINYQLEDDMDEDVQRETNLLKNAFDEEDDNVPLKIHDLSKQFTSIIPTGCCRLKRKKLKALHPLSLQVGRGERFALLGVNGAGKTTAFRMISGELKPDNGNIMVNGHHLENDRNSAYSHIGYCPQFDALDNFLSVEEECNFYSNIHYRTAKETKKIVSQIIKKFDLERYVKSQISSLSIGNRRKLASAIAIIGDANIVLLDEPTSGMDPTARRFLWKQIRHISEMGKAIIFTSHAMDECEQLATRLGILVNGRLKCLGTAKHLRKKFGKGFTLIIKLNENISNYHLLQKNIINRFTEMIGEVQLLETYSTTIKLRILNESLDTLKLYEVLWQLKNIEWIHHSSFSPTTLDEIFIEFAKQQYYEEGNRRSIVSNQSFSI
ncbi:hypothetical protein SNEBB_011309 [Seison nebaliae]|nr:hypothetical protein SNEBB_011309 [Seison nebaliae]